MTDVRGLFGEIDIYLFDQLLKGRFPPAARLLDAGCGAGRNLVFFLREGYEVCGVDLDPGGVAEVRRLAARLAPHLPAENFRVADVADLPFADASFDAVISSAVLHFASDERHFARMLDGMWRALKDGGLLFARLASDIGIEGRVRPIGGRRFLLPDGTERFLVDERVLAGEAARLGGELVEPIKTTNVEHRRCMTTWVLRKGAAPRGG
jgi:tellurite methyltransferase